MRPYLAAVGDSTVLYGTPGGAGGGDERILRNMSGLRHGLGILTESAGSQEPNDRVDMQMHAAESVLRFYRERFDDVVMVVTEAPERKAVTGEIGRASCRERVQGKVGAGVCKRDGENSVGRVRGV